MTTLVNLGGRVPIELGERLGSGRRGSIYAVTGEPHLAAKLYDRGISPRSLERHLAAFARQWLDVNGQPRLAWPIAPVMDDLGQRTGFVMLRLPSEWRIVDYCLTVDDRGSVGWALDWDVLRVMARQLASRVHEVHADGLVIADLSAANVMVTASGQVALVDCDDMLWADELADGSVSALTSPGYTAPEILRGSGQVSKHSDRWSLGVLICRLLLDGSHPFEVAPEHGRSGGQATVDDNVRDHRTRYRRGSFFRRFAHSSETLEGALPLDVLPPEILELARQCFDDGDKEVHARPRALDWVAALDRVKVHRCAEVRTHAFSAHQAECPWCTHVPDLFPGAAAPLWNGATP